MATHLRSVRLKVLLDAFYTDHRQKAFVILQKSWKTIHDLQEHIQKIFRIPISVFLTVDGCLLPCDEGIHVVSETDAVKVHPTSTTFSLLSDAFAQARIYSTAEGTPGTGTSGLSSPGFARSAPKKQKNEKSVTPKECPPKPVVTIVDVVQKVEKDALPARPKRQRKRKRKSKGSAVAPEEQQIVAVHAISEANAPEHKVNLHLRFDNNQQSAKFEDTQAGPAALRKNPFTLPHAARVIRATRKDVSIKQFEDNSQSPIVQAIQATAQPFIIQAPEPVDEKLPIKPEKIGESSLEAMRHHIDELNLPAVDLVDLKQDDLIAFRIMKLTANYVPDISAYIIGLVQSIEAANVIIYVMAGVDETREPSGKFSLDDDETAVDSIDEQLLYIQRSEILNAKYVKV